MTARGLLALMFGLALTACSPPNTAPMTLPPADGRAARIIIGDGYRYLVNYQGLAQARGKVFLRVTRATPPELDYSDGLVAKKVAQAYCAGFNRDLNPVAFGQFSAPASWMFEGGCT